MGDFWGIAPQPPTPRQFEILTLISVGMTNAQIGAELHISEKTVKTHVSAMLRRMRVETRGHAIATGFREGWLA